MDNQMSDPQMVEKSSFYWPSYILATYVSVDYTMIVCCVCANIRLRLLLLSFVFLACVTFLIWCVPVKY